MRDDIAISVDDVSKTFHLPYDNQDSIKLKFQNIFQRQNKSNDRYQALKKIDLEIKKGEFIGILGRNGAGKSTLLRIIAEIYQPTTGKVSVAGRIVPFIELGVGFNKNLSGRDNVYLNGAMLGFTRHEIDKMYDSIVDFAELHKFMNQKLRNFSSGMKVRLAFSVAIKAEADILLLDEVLAVGDAAFKRKCYDYFDTLKEGKKTIVLVTHNMSAVREYCDRVVLIEDGKIAFDGGAEEAVEKYYNIFNSEVDNKSKEKKLSLNNVKATINDDKLVFKVEMSNKTPKAIADVLVRIAIKKQNGRVVAGFDNKNIEEPFEIDFKPREKKTLVYEVPNIFGNGNYSINAAIRSISKGDYEDEDGEVEGTTAEAYDSRKNFAIFSIRKPGLVTPVILPARVRKTGQSSQKQT